MRYEIASDRGRAGFNAYCPERRCEHKEFGTTKGRARDAVNQHIKKTHDVERAEAERQKTLRREAEREAKESKQAAREEAKQRKQEERDERNAKKAAKDKGGVVVKTGRGGFEVVTDPTDRRLTGKQRRELKKIRYNELRGKVGDRNAKILAELDKTPVGQIHKIRGLHTYGIPGVPDGQNVNGVVYDENGQRVTHDVLSRYVQGWGD